MNRPAPISVFSDQRRTKSTIWSRVSCGTQTPVRAPQEFFLARRAPPSVPPRPHPWSGSSSPDRRSAPARRNGWAALSAERQPRRSRRTPSASGRRPWAGVPVCHTAPRSAPAPADAASGWQLSLPACSASVASSCVRSIILTGERFLHFQLNRNRSPLGAGPAGWQLGPPRHAPRHARGSKPTAQSGGPVSEKTPVAFPTHLGPTGRESAKGPQPQGGLQYGARPRSRKRLSTRRAGARPYPSARRLGVGAARRFGPGAARECPGSRRHRRLHHLHHGVWRHVFGFREERDARPLGVVVHPDQISTAHL